VKFWASPSLTCSFVYRRRVIFPFQIANVNNTERLNINRCRKLDVFGKTSLIFNLISVPIKPQTLNCCHYAIRNSAIGFGKKPNYNRKQKPFVSPISWSQIRHWCTLNNHDTIITTNALKTLLCVWQKSYWFGWMKYVSNRFSFLLAALTVIIPYLFSQGNFFGHINVCVWFQNYRIRYYIVYLAKIYKIEIK